jgi:hypothetical protein
MFTRLQIARTTVNNSPPPDGSLADVEALLAQQDEATRITWEFASEVRRDDPLLNTLAVNLGLTDQQINEFFIAASAL